jgi:hypothetical protein
MALCSDVGQPPAAGSSWHRHRVTRRQCTPDAAKRAARGAPVHYVGAVMRVHSERVLTSAVVVAMMLLVGARPSHADDCVLAPLVFQRDASVGRGTFCFTFLCRGDRWFFQHVRATHLRTELGEAE